MITERQAAAVKAICERHPEHRLAKYRDWRTCCQVACYHLRLLDLNAAPPRLRVLDLGAGLSYFSAECRRLGHEAISLDLPDDLPREVAETLGVPYIGWMIVAYNELPVMGPFDLITAIRLNMTEPVRWGWPEYEWFAEHVLSLLSPGGKWYMDPNRGDNVRFVLDAERWQEMLGGRAHVYQPTRDTIVIQKA